MHCRTCNGLIATSCPTCVIGKPSQTWLDEAMRLADDLSHAALIVGQRYAESAAFFGDGPAPDRAVQIIQKAEALRDKYRAALLSHLGRVS